MTIGQFARRTHLERTRAEIARLRRRQHRDRARHPVRDRLGRRLRPRCRAAPRRPADLVPRRARRRGGRVRRLRPQLPRGLPRRERPRDARARRARRGHVRASARSSHRAASPSTCTPSATPASPTVRRAYVCSGSARSSTHCSHPPHASTAIVLLVNGAVHPSPALTLPWAIGVPLGFAAAIWAVGHRAALPRHDRLARSGLGQALDSIYVLRCLFCSAYAPRRPDRDGGLLVRRHRLPLGVPAGVHARHAGHRDPPHRLCDRLRADAADAAVRRRRRSRGAACRSRSPGRASRSPQRCSPCSRIASSTSGCRSSPQRSGCAA